VKNVTAVSLLNRVFVRDFRHATLLCCVFSLWTACDVCLRIPRLSLSAVVFRWDRGWTSRPPGHREGNKNVVFKSIWFRWHSSQCAERNEWRLSSGKDGNVHCEWTCMSCTITFLLGLYYKLFSPSIWTVLLTIKCQFYHQQFWPQPAWMNFVVLYVLIYKKTFAYTLLYCYAHKVTKVLWWPVLYAAVYQLNCRFGCR